MATSGSTWAEVSDQEPAMSDDDSSLHPAPPCKRTEQIKLTGVQTFFQPAENS